MRRTISGAGQAGGHRRKWYNGESISFHANLPACRLPARGEQPDLAHAERISNDDQRAFGQQFLSPSSGVRCGNTQKLVVGFKVTFIHCPLQPVEGFLSLVIPERKSSGMTSTAQARGISAHTAINGSSDSPSVRIKPPSINSSPHRSHPLSRACSLHSPGGCVKRATTRTNAVLLACLQLSLAWSDESPGDVP